MIPTNLTLETTRINYLPRVASGVQPAPMIHLGHYFGAIKQHIELQHEYPGQTFISIADYHSLTRPRISTSLRDNTIELATAYLALGLDPNKAILYRQSDVPQALELFWLLCCLAPVSELSRVPTFKSPEEGSNGSIGLLSYPILMAADILGLRATYVPVGSDQAINIERVRDVAQSFNRAFKADFLPIPQIMISPNAKVRGTDGRKMMNVYGNAIGLFEQFYTLNRKVMSIKTDSRGRHEPKDPDVCNVFHLYSLVASPDKVEELRQRYVAGAVDYSDAKRALTQVIQECFATASEEYYKLKKSPDYVADVLREGFRQAAEEVEITLEAARLAVGLSL
jgi:tryptophanyl-tRNA synthetase